MFAYSSHRARGLAAALGLAAGAAFAGGPAPAEAVLDGHEAPSGETFKSYIVDVGTGLGVYMEFPGGPGGRPFRVLYDTGKGQSEGLDNDLCSFLTSEKVGLKPADGDFEGDVIDYFILSHPHEDHFNGGRPVFDLFDVRNVIESKQIPGYKYLKRFKGPAITEIAAAKAAGKDAHYYVVGLPYPNGFAGVREGKAYDEYALCQANVPDYLAGQIDCDAARGKVRFPFGPDQVAQRVNWPVFALMGFSMKGKKFVAPELLASELEVDVIPVGTQFQLGRHGGFHVVHGDTIAAFDPKIHDRKTYAAAWPYYKVADLNDASVSIQAYYKAATVLVPGDTEGRHKKPSKTIRLSEVFGSASGDEAYTRDDLMKALRRDRPEAEHIGVRPGFERYFLDARELLLLGLNSYVTFDHITPRGFASKVDDEPVEIAAKQFTAAGQIPDAAIGWADRSDDLRAAVDPRWKHRLLQFHRDLGLNKQKWTALKGRFNGWNRGAKRRLKFEDGRYQLDWDEPVYTITNLIQLTERIYYVDPGLANLLAGFIMRSEIFLDYIAPADRTKHALRGEKHMIDVARQIKRESGRDVLKGDVLILGHHGSFTSSSLGFVHAVNPNVGVISADDKSYSGSTLPDFSALFWNMNTHHPDSRETLHSLFFHADELARRRGEVPDDYTKRNGYSMGAAKVFRARRRWALPLWRTDFNDDLENVNVLMDNILIESDGRRPIWDWARHRRKGQPGAELAKVPEGAKPGEYAYWSHDLIVKHPPGSAPVRPKDPTGEIRTFDITHRLPMRLALERARVKPVVVEDEDFEPEDWTFHHH